MKTFVLSGSVGLPGVTMQGLPGAPMTDENGVYSAEVKYNWSGTVTPVKLGYTFEPKQKVYQGVVDNQTSENYEAKLVTFTISGSAGLPGVKMKGLPGDPISDQGGRYTATVEYGWSGTIIPEKEGYRFDPSSKMYSQLTKDQANETYAAHELTFAISGSVGVDGVTMKGLPGAPVTAGGGTYRVDVPYGWTGKATPTKEGHEFTPVERDYAQIMSAQTNQNYTARVFTYQISGSTGMPGVTLEGLPGDPVTDTDGFYTAIIEHGWSGKVTPKRAGFTFEPASKNYAKVTADYENQNYSASLIQLTISGSAGTSSVVLEGLPGNVVCDATGFYTVKVDYGWGGTVTPKKEGYSFEPANKIYSSVIQDQLNQNFQGQRITFKISGNVNLPGVVLEGLPSRPVSGADGSYSVVVDYKWSGSVTPKKPGYIFEPETKKYDEVLASEMSEDYTARIIQHTVSGRIMAQTGPVTGVFLLADKNGGSATTDANGEFQLLVDHGWSGKIIPQKDGFTFTPGSKTFEPVVQDVSNAGFTGTVKMMTITDSIVFGDEPIQGVTITATPSEVTATTDAKGKYSIKVPYGWTGELSPTKPGFDFDPPSISYLNVTEDIDKTVTQRQVLPPDTVLTREVPPVATAPTGTAPTGSVPTGSVPTGTVPTGTVPTGTTPSSPGPVRVVEPAGTDSAAALMRERIQQLEAELTALTDGGTGTSPGGTGIQTIQGDGAVTVPGPAADMATMGPPVLDGPAVNGTFIRENLLDVLTKISAQTQVKIFVDQTVKPTPVSVKVTGAPLETALQGILGQDYKFKRVGDAYLVFKPITNSFMGDDLRQALQDIAMTAGVTIVPDETVVGTVNADLNEVPLETALNIVLAGSPYVVKKTPNYYLVASRAVKDSAFPDVSETRNVFLNYASPRKVSALLSSAFADYVRADTDPNSHLISVIAPPALAERIIADIKRIDSRPRHVLLDARVVVMERGDLLDMGVEWGWPTITAGAFGNSFLPGDDGGGSWPWGVGLGYSPDKTFTESLLLALNLLQENGQADIVSNPQVLAQDGRMSQISVLTEEYFMLTAPVNNNAVFYSQTEMVNITSGTTLSITPRIGDNNDITLEMATEVSDSIPAGRGSDLPVVTRRQAKNVVTVMDGGTVALAGLTESRSRIKDKRVPRLSNLPLVGWLFKNTESDQSTREVAVFVTANLVPEVGMTGAQMSQPQPPIGTMQPTGARFEDEIRRSLSLQGR